jgi:peroxiredoxin
MAQLRQDYAQFVGRDTEVLVISPEDAAEVQAYWQREALPYPGLIDPGHAVANRYGQEVNLLKLGRMPAMVVLDRQGVVRFEHHAFGMQDIPANSKILGLLDELNRAWGSELVPERAAV